MDRREFLTALLSGVGLAGAAPVLGPLPALAGDTPSPAPDASGRLTIIERSIEVNNRSAKVFGLVRPDGGRGLTLDAGSNFDVALANNSSEPTLIHWHGLTPPWPQDGVPDNPAPLLKSGETRRYKFPVGDGGTFWMHAHTLQEQRLLAAPLIVRTEEDRRRDEQEVVILLHDFTFKAPEEVLAGLKGGAQASPMNHSMAMATSMNKLMSGTMGQHMQMMQGGGMSGVSMMMDVNDIDFDAYLANDRTLDDPEVVQVEKGGRVRLRIINGATATAFTIDLGAAGGELIAVDGQPVLPVKGTRFPIAMGQRLDIRTQIPAAASALPVLALREGAKERTGVVLATPGATVARLPVVGNSDGPAVSLDVETRLRAVKPLAARRADRRYGLILTGGMDGYNWAIAGDDLKVKAGERVEITMRNMSMMSHPMHLHGHHFQVVEINGSPVGGAVRDTVMLPHMAVVKVAFDANNPGNWPLHCHQLYHMASGMMTFVPYDSAS